MPFDDAGLVALGRRVVELEASAVHAVGTRLDDRFAKAVRLLADASGRVIVSGVGKSGLSRGSSPPRSRQPAPRRRISIRWTRCTAIWGRRTERCRDRAEQERRVGGAVRAGRDRSSEWGCRSSPSPAALDSTLARIAAVALDAIGRRGGVPARSRADHQHDRGAGARRRAGHRVARGEGVSAGGLRRASPGRLARPKAAPQGARRDGPSRAHAAAGCDDASRGGEPGARSRTGAGGGARPAGRGAHDRRSDAAGRARPGLSRLPGARGHDRDPKTAGPEDLAAAAVGTMERHGVIALPVLDDSGAVVGAVHLHDLMRAGAV